ncbi:hypothetical protein A3K86_01560 [Photobacterium jeanii]|uniref:Orc1-like AAA ATPase domain-containing protein n=1 Tax=Photobacterium jeanii TaxID=858640 RepID=A0A178KKY2_9GAMM|nr:XRE family transcriptional regulator [Photobacterium jeanii]OAN17635.1 hypothetical protein A3K86_01560 [Photobacterium jeanii]PST92708.1 XRE family transcriptional regulator [Photobacterium jeanii]
MTATILIDGNKLKQLRDNLALSQEGLEYACSQKKGCSVSIATIKRAELGHPLSRRTAARLAKFFSIEIDELLKASEPSWDAPFEVKAVSSNEYCDAVVLWFRSADNQQISQLMEALKPFPLLLNQRIGNTVILALPFRFNEQLTSLPIQQLLLSLSERSHYYTGLVCLHRLARSAITTSDDQWIIDEFQIQSISDLASQLTPQQLAISDSISCLSEVYFDYQPANNIDGFKLLSAQKQNKGDVTFGRDYERQQFAHAVKHCEADNAEGIVFVSGYQGVGKTHLMSTFGWDAQQHGCQVIQLNLALSLLDMPRAVTQLSGLLKAVTDGSLQNERVGNEIKKHPYLNQFAALRVGCSKGQSCAPLVVMLDDFHLLDRQTITQLQLLMATQSSQAILWVLSFQPCSAMAEFIEQLKYLKVNQTHLALSPLEQKAMIQIANNYSEVDEANKEAYLQMARGYPFVVNQLLLNHNKAQRFPETIMRPLCTELKLLSPSLRATMAMVTFSDGALPMSSYQQVFANADTLISSLCQQGLVCINFAQKVSLTSPLPALLVDDWLSDKEKQSAYIVSAQQLEECQAELTIDEVMKQGQYFALGGNWFSAARCCWVCGQRQLQHEEYAKAKKHLELGLEYLQKAPTDDAVNTLVLDIRLSLASITRINFGWVSHCTLLAYQNCIRLAEQQTCNKRYCIALAGLWVTQLMATEFELSIQTANKILALAEKEKDPLCISQAHSFLANSLFWKAEHEQTIEHARLAIGYANYASEDVIGASIGVDSKVLACCFGALSSSVIEDNDNLHYFQFLMHSVTEKESPFNFAIYLQGQIWLAYHQRNSHEVVRLAEQLLAHSKQYNFPFYKGVAMLFLGWGLYFTQNAMNALAMIEEGYCHWLGASGDQIAFSLYSLIAAEVLIHQSHQDKAQTRLETALLKAEATGECVYLVPIQTYLTQCRMSSKRRVGPNTINEEVAVYSNLSQPNPPLANSNAQNEALFKDVGWYINESTVLN